MKSLLSVTAATAAAIALAGCGMSASSHANAAAPAVSSAMANPSVSADTARLEGELLASYQAHFTPAHPVTSMKAAIRAVFPQGDAGAIAAYAVAQLTPAVATSSGPGSARDAWAQKVVAYALAQGASPSPAASQS